MMQRSLKALKKRGFDDNPSSLFGPMLFVEYLTSALVTFVLSLVTSPGVSTSAFQSEIRTLRTHLVDAHKQQDVPEAVAKYQFKKVVHSISM